MEIKNARIISAELSMEDHGCFTMWLMLEDSGWGGGINRIGHITEDKWFSYKEFYKKESDGKWQEK